MCSSLILYSVIYSEVRCLDVALSRGSESLVRGAARSSFGWPALPSTFQVRGAMAACNEARGQV